MDSEEARAIGFALWQVRDHRRKGLRLVAELAGMSKDTLNRIERGLLSPTLAQLHALAEVLHVSVSELTRLPFPAPANGHTDGTIKAIGLALDAIEAGRPHGMMLPIRVLREQVTRLHALRRACQFAEVATELPGLVRNLHTTLATGVDHSDLLELAVRLHVHVTRLWLVYAGAEDHLIRRVVFLALRLAQERNEVTTLATASFGIAETLLGGESFREGRAELDSVALPPTTADTAGLIGVLSTAQATAAVLDSRPSDATAAMDNAAELAGRFGSTDSKADSLGIVFSPMHAGLCRMWLALEAGEPDQAVRIGQDLRPERHPFKEIRAWYWVDYGRALTRLPKRHSDAVMALRTAEDIFPTKVLRDPFVRDSLAVLLPGARRDAAGEELRGMARRAGLPVA